MTVLLTVGHSTLSADAFTRMLLADGVELLVDIRHFPGSRRHPHFGRGEMSKWVPDAGVQYRWSICLGGYRKPSPDSPHVGLRHPSFRAYADYMSDSREFSDGLALVLAGASSMRTAVMCSEALWWRCHRRLVSDAATLLHGAEVMHLTQNGRRSPHKVTDCARLTGSTITYDLGALATSELTWAKS